VSRHIRSVLKLLAVGRPFGSRSLFTDSQGERIVPSLGCDEGIGAGSAVVLWLKGKSPGKTLLRAFSLRTCLKRGLKPSPASHGEALERLKPLFYRWQWILENQPGWLFKQVLSCSICWMSRAIAEQCSSNKRQKSFSKMKHRDCRSWITSHDL
jgi:hypothetical protein